MQPGPSAGTVLPAAPGSAGACDQPTAIAWGHLIQRPLEEAENLQLTSGLGSSLRFQPVPCFHFSLGCQTPPRHQGCSEVTSSPRRWTRRWVEVLAEPVPPMSREDAAYGSGRRAEMLKKK